MLSTDFHLAPSLRISGSVPLLPTMYPNCLDKISIFLPFMAVKECRLLPKLRWCVTQYWRRVVALPPPPPKQRCAQYEFSSPHSPPPPSFSTQMNSSFLSFGWRHWGKLRKIWECVFATNKQHFKTSQYVWCRGRVLRGGSDPTCTKIFCKGHYSQIFWLLLLKKSCSFAF